MSAGGHRTEQTKDTCLSVRRWGAEPSFGTFEPLGTEVHSSDVT
jgi:hypothetical protein